MSAPGTYQSWVRQGAKAAHCSETDIYCSDDSALSNRIESEDDEADLLVFLKAGRLRVQKQVRRGLADGSKR